MSCPKISVQEASIAVASIYKIRGNYSELDSCQDCNFKLKATDQQTYVVKFSNELTSLAEVQFQNDVLLHLNAVDKTTKYPVPVCIPGSKDETIFTTSIRGTSYHLRLLTFVKGQMLSDFTYLAPSVLHSFGGFIWSLNHHLRSFTGRSGTGSSEQDHRVSEWDMRYAVSKVHEYMPLISSDKAAADALLSVTDNINNILQPLHQKFARQVIHSDLAHYNVVAKRMSNGRPMIEGVIDFGDVVNSWLIGDLAIAIAPLLSNVDQDVMGDTRTGIQSGRGEGGRNCVQCAADMLFGYQQAALRRAAAAEMSGSDKRQVGVLNKAEICALWPLVVLRCVVLVVHVKKQLQLDPDNDYCRDELAQSQATLERVKTVPMYYAEHAMRAAARAAAASVSTEISDMTSLSTRNSSTAPATVADVPVTMTESSHSKSITSPAHKTAQALLDIFVKPFFKLSKKGSADNICFLNIGPTSPSQSAGSWLSEPTAGVASPSSPSSCAVSRAEAGWRAAINRALLFYKAEQKQEHELLPPDTLLSVGNTALNDAEAATARVTTAFVVRHGEAQMHLSKLRSLSAPHTVPLHSTVLLPLTTALYAPCDATLYFLTPAPLSATINCGSAAAKNTSSSANNSTTPAGSTSRSCCCTTTWCPLVMSANIEHCSQCDPAVNISSDKAQRPVLLLVPTAGTSESKTSGTNNSNSSSSNSSSSNSSSSSSSTMTPAPGPSLLIWGDLDTYISLSSSNKSGVTAASFYAAGNKKTNKFFGTQPIAAGQGVQIKAGEQFATASNATFSSSRNNYEGVGNASVSYDLCAIRMQVLPAGFSSTATAANTETDTDTETDTGDVQQGVFQFNQSVAAALQNRKEQYGPAFLPPLYCSSAPFESKLWTELCPDPMPALIQREDLLLHSPPAAAAGAVSPSAVEKRYRHFASNQEHYYPHIEPPVIERGFQTFLYDSGGRAYLDTVNNVAAVGHSHPAVYNATLKQLNLLNTNSRFLYRILGEYTEKLVRTIPTDITQAGQLNTVFLVNSGSEATDLAMRIARTVSTKRHDKKLKQSSEVLASSSGPPVAGAAAPLLLPAVVQSEGGFNRDVICIHGGYHGITTTSNEVSTTLNDDPCSLERLPRWVHLVAMPNLYRGEFNVHNRRGQLQRSGSCVPADKAEEVYFAHKYAGYVEHTLEELKKDGRYPSVFIAEPLSGNAGGVCIPPGYLQQVYKAVRAHGGLCISDEVQVGMGRLGSSFWGFMDHGVVPDIITMAKACGNGHPLGFVITSKAIAAEFGAADGSFFSSAGGGPVSCAAGIAVLDTIKKEHLQKNAHEVGAYMNKKLLELAAEFPQTIGCIHGYGFYQGIELIITREEQCDQADKCNATAHLSSKNSGGGGGGGGGDGNNSLTPAAPATDVAYAVCERMLSLGVICHNTGDYSNVLKMKPPLTFCYEDADFFVAALRKVMKEGW